MTVDDKQPYRNGEREQRRIDPVVPAVIAPPPDEAGPIPELQPEPVTPVVPAHPPESPQDKHFKIFYGDVGYTYEALFGDYLRGAKVIDIEDPYIRSPHQVGNFVRFCELAVKVGAAQTINLTTGFDDDEEQRKETEEKLQSLAGSLLDYGIKLNLSFSEHVHDREIRLDNGWKIKVGRDLDIYQKPDSWFCIGVNDLERRPCLETIVDIFRDEETV